MWCNTFLYHAYFRGFKMITEKTATKAIKYLFDKNNLTILQICQLLDLQYDEVYTALVCEEEEYHD